QRFTGKERDGETGLDYFGFRYMSSARGRFTSPDPILVTPARMVDPQRFNLYVYARNNPLKFLDLDGRDIYLANDSEEERRKALYSITKNLSTREQRNIGYRQNAQGKYELYIKDASKINLSKVSEGYQQLANRIGNHDLQINFTLVPTGGAVMDPNGNSLSHSTLSGWNGSGGVTYYPPGTGNADVFVAEGGKPTGVAGLTASGRDVGIAFLEYIITAHELFGETLKLTPGNTWLQQNPVQDSVADVEVENKVRTFHGLPQRSGKDHANYPVVQSITVRP
ncbi:MAG: RHS repeat-associated core domain-containing protein, partial [Bryobacterales bacterium]|nr:RHS repeat-associated core domain-containing protein [Bryobacterales bacterium]